MENFVEKVVDYVGKVIVNKWTKPGKLLREPSFISMIIHPLRFYPQLIHNIIHRKGEGCPRKENPIITQEERGFCPDFHISTITTTNFNYHSVGKVVIAYNY